MCASLILLIMISYKTWNVAVECYLKCYMRHDKEKLFVKRGWRDDSGLTASVKNPGLVPRTHLAAEKHL